jgi:hypothetical protein
MGSGCIHPYYLDLDTSWECSTSRPGRSTPGERAPGTLWIGSWVCPRTGLNAVKKREFLPIPGLKLRPFDRPSRS